MDSAVGIVHSTAQAIHCIYEMLLISERLVFAHIYTHIYIYLYIYLCIYIFIAANKQQTSS